MDLKILLTALLVQYQPFDFFRWPQHLCFLLGHCGKDAPPSGAVNKAHFRINCVSQAMHYRRAQFLLGHMKVLQPFITPQAAARIRCRIDPPWPLSRPSPLLFHMRSSASASLHPDSPQVSAHGARMAIKPTPYAVGNLPMSNMLLRQRHRRLRNARP